MVVSSYGNKAGYSTGVELAEDQCKCRPALLCLLPSANTTFACVMTKSLPIFILDFSTCTG